MVVSFGWIFKKSIFHLIGVRLNNHDDTLRIDQNNNITWLLAWFDAKKKS